MSNQTEAIYQTARPPYSISTDRNLLDINVIHGYLYHSYWSPGVPRTVVQKVIEHSLNFGLYYDAQPGDAQPGPQQVGFARVVTDYGSFAYLADVFILPEHRGQRLGVWLVETIIDCPILQNLRSFVLATRDAHELYRKVGFTAIDSSRFMVKPYEVPWRDHGLIQE